MVSVIVPIYNSEKYLKRCVDSILSQTFSDFELLLVDDGSTDGSGSICDEYSVKDSRVRVFHKENGGVSSARNLGLDNARGEWITFVDSDDYLEESFLAELSVFEDVDWVVSGVSFVNNGVVFVPPLIEKIRVDVDLPLIDSQLSKDYFRTPWAKLYKHSIILQNNLRFDSCLYIGEDTEFNLRYMQSVECVGFSLEALYCYNDDEKQPYKYVMNPESYQRHISLLLEDLDVLSRKYCYEFPVLRGSLKGYFKGLLFLHLSGLRKYASFKKEAISFRKYGCIWYEASNLNELFKTCIIKYLPFLAYAYFKRLNDR